MQLFVYFPSEIALPQSRRLKEENFTKDRVSHIRSPSTGSLKFNFFDLLQGFFWGGFCWGGWKLIPRAASDGDRNDRIHPKNCWERRGDEAGGRRDSFLGVKLQHQDNLWKCEALCSFSHPLLVLALSGWALMGISSQGVSLGNQGPVQCAVKGIPHPHSLFCFI